MNKQTNTNRNSRKDIVSGVLVLLMMALIAIIFYLDPAESTAVAAGRWKSPARTLLIDDSDGWVTVIKIVTPDGKRSYDVFRMWDGNGRGTMQVVPINSPAKKEVKDK